MNFVVADDSQQARNYVRSILARAGHTVVAVAVNGIEAVALCERHRPDVALLDISMPHKNGIEAAAEIIAAQTAGHVIVASSNMQANIVHQARAAGVTGIVGKPFVDVQLLKKLAEIVPGFTYGT